MSIKEKIKTQFMLEQTGVEPFLLRFWLVVVAALSLTAAYMHMSIGLNNDHLAQLFMAKKLMEGKKLYVDAFDVNPPLIYMLYVLPLFFTRALGVPAFLALNGLTLAGIAASLVVSARIMRHSHFSRLAFWIVLGTFALELLVASFIDQVYGDREHLLIILLSPFLLLYSPWVEREKVPQKLRAAIAYMAAVGLALKPYFYVFYIAVALFEYWKARSLKGLLLQKELQIVAKFAVAYLLVILLFFYDFVGTIVPIGRLIYQTLSWGADSKFGAVWAVMIPHYTPVVVVGMLVLWCAAPARIGREFFYMLLMAAAALGSYLLSGGWYYTQYPFIATMLAFSVMVATFSLRYCDVVKSVEVRAAYKLAIASAVAGALVYGFVWPSYERGAYDFKLQADYGRPFSVQTIKPEVLAKFDTHLEKHPRYMFLNVNFWAFHLEKPGTKRQAVGRFSSLGTLPSIVAFSSRSDKEAEYEKLVQYTTRSLSEDIVRQKPGLIIVDTSPKKRGLPMNYSMLDFLKTQPNFADAWQDYQLTEKIDECNWQPEQLCAFEIYYRKQY